MTTAWKSGDDQSKNQKPAKHATNNTTITETIISSWSRQQKLTMIAGFAILGLMLGVIACSKQSEKPALVGVSKPTATSASNAESTASTAAVTPTATTAPAEPAKKAARKRPANVTYRDANSGVSFLFPRKALLNSGEKGQPLGAPLDDALMNFTQPGGVAIATVELPNTYPGTDFASAFFNVNVNRSVSEQECAHFALVDSHNVNGAAADAEKMKVGAEEMATTSNFSASALTQTETQYYHNYENGACYEYVLSVGTAGYGVKDGVEPVNRDEVFAKLEKILATVKINPTEQPAVAEQTGSGIPSGKE
jgi:hypothetical protein